MLCEEMRDGASTIFPHRAAPPRGCQSARTRRCWSHDGADLAAAVETIREIGDDARSTGGQRRVHGSRSGTERRRPVRSGDGAARLLRPLKAASCRTGRALLLWWRRCDARPGPAGANEPEPASSRSAAGAEPADRAGLGTVTGDRRVACPRARRRAQRCPRAMPPPSRSSRPDGRGGEVETPAWHWPTR